MITRLETVSCEVCNSADFRICYSKRDKFRIEPDPFNVVACQICGLTQINPRPTVSEIGKFYPDHYQWKEGEAEEPLGFAGRLEKAYRYHQLGSEIKRMKKRIPAGGKILDVGCGTGDRMELMRRAGWEVYGVETSEQAHYAKHHFKLPVFHGILEDAGYENYFFDAVVLYNVLEHLHSPRKVLKEIGRILKPGGQLLVEVPNNQSIQAGIFKGRWAAADVPRDLYYFDACTLTRLLKETGFQVQEINYDTDFWHPPTLVISLFPSLDPQLIWSHEANDQKGGIIKRVFWAALTLLAAPFAYLENLLGRGALFTVFAVKEKP